jgi:hypothetical protein
MKKILTLTLASAISLALIGCGGSSNKDKNPNDVVLNYDKNSTSAKYDLSDYMFNKNGKIINTIEKVFINKKGKKEFENLPKDSVEESFHTITTEINTTSVKEFKDDVLDASYVISDDRISIIAEDLNTSFVRYVDDGDYFAKWSDNDIESGITINTQTVCKVVGHQDSITVKGKEYSDILKVNCKINASSSDNQKLQGKLYESKSDVNFDTYFAKDIGEVMSDSEGCDIAKLDGKEFFNECKKETTHITTIN